MNRWIVSPGQLNVSADQVPHGFNCCTFNGQWNNLFQNMAPESGQTYTFSVDKVDIPVGREAVFDRFQIFNDGDLIVRTKKVGPVQATFSYCVKSKRMTSNMAYHILPMSIGRLWPAGEHLSNIIAFDMLRNKKMMFLHGAAFNLDGKTICIFSPGQTGKTSTIARLLKMGAKYIAEDVILTDGRSIYLMTPYKEEIANHVKNRDSLLFTSAVDQIYICAPNGTTEGRSSRERAVSYLRMFSNRVPFQSDSLVLAILTYHGLDFRDLENQAIQTVERLVDNTDIQFSKSIDDVVAGLNVY